MFENKTILTGVKPTGTPHIGNYFGVIKPALDIGKKALENNGKHFMFVADYHAINAEKDANVLNQKIKEVASVYLAFGLDTDKSVFYRQSDIPEIHEFTTILYAYTPKGFMNKAHAYKACVDKNRLNGKPDDDGINMGLYNYPILMAADILLFNSKFVPVGADQKQHVEMARDIAKYFNKKYGYTLVVPQERIQEKTATLVGLDGRKMSKSYGNQVPLFCDEKKLQKLIASIKTDSSLPTEPKSTGP